MGFFYICFAADLRHRRRRRRMSFRSWMVGRRCSALEPITIQWAIYLEAVRPGLAAAAAEWNQQLYGQQIVSAWVVCGPCGPRGPGRTGPIPISSCFYGYLLLSSLHTQQWIRNSLHTYRPSPPPVGAAEGAPCGPNSVASFCSFLLLLQPNVCRGNFDTFLITKVPNEKWAHCTRRRRRRRHSSSRRLFTQCENNCESSLNLTLNYTNGISEAQTIIRCGMERQEGEERRQQSPRTALQLYNWLEEVRLWRPEELFGIKDVLVVVPAKFFLLNNNRRRFQLGSHAVFVSNSTLCTFGRGGEIYQ